MFKKKTTEIEEITEKVQWIWVDGYKATDADMKCHGYQYRFGETHSMPEEMVKMCESGFHLCKKLHHVFRYYSIGDGHRYFKVKALVRIKDFVDYDKENTRTLCLSTIDKLVAKSIIFERELTVDEIFECYIQDCGHSQIVKDFSTEERELALQKGFTYVKERRKVLNLVKLGYSEEMSWYIVENRSFMYDLANALGTQPDVSMDVKMLILFGDKNIVEGLFTLNNDFVMPMRLTNIDGRIKE